MLLNSFLLIAAAQTLAPDSNWRTPVEKWRVEYAENMCTLARSYGTKEKPLILGFKPSPMSDKLQLVLIGSGQGRPAYVKTKVAVNEAAPVEQLALSFITPKAPLRITLIDLTRADLEPLAKQGRLSVTIGKDAAVNLAVDRFDVALRGLEACEKDLLKHWGMNEAAQAAIVAKPLLLQNIAAYLSDNDYPDQAIRNNEQGTSGVRFWVGTDGKPSDCKVVEPSSSTLLDETTCRIVTTRARFSPALDREGKPVSSLSFTRIRWVLPDG